MVHPEAPIFLKHNGVHLQKKGDPPAYCRMSVLPVVKITGGLRFEKAGAAGSFMRWQRNRLRVSSGSAPFVEVKSSGGPFVKIGNVEMCMMMHGEMMYLKTKRMGDVVSGCSLWKMSTCEHDDCD